MKKHSDMPSLEEWRSLYSEATAFRELKPWTWMSDSDLFGVVNPDDGQTGYCCVLGELEEVFALLLHLGNEGLQAYRSLQSAEFDLHDSEIAHTQSCLMASFENRRDLAQQDTAIIKKLGLKFRGRDAWPQFRSYRPGFVPWHLVKWEARFMSVALEQAAIVAKRLRQEPNLLQSHGKDLLLTRVPAGKDVNEDWVDRWIELPEIEEKMIPPPALDEIRLKRLAKTHKSGNETWEIDFFHFVGAVEEGERPYFPMVAVIMDHGTGLALHFWLQPPWEFFHRFAEDFLGFMEKTGLLLPADILVSKKEAFKTIKPIASRLGVNLSMVDLLVHAKNFRENMVAHL